MLPLQQLKLQPAVIKDNLIKVKSETGKIFHFMNNYDDEWAESFPFDFDYAKLMSLIWVAWWQSR